MRPAKCATSLLTIGEAGMAKKKTKANAEVCGTANSEASSSIELMRDAKGHARWAIKLYGNRDEMDAVLEQVLELDKSLQLRANR